MKRNQEEDQKVWRAMTRSNIEELKRLLQDHSESDRHELYLHLRKEFPIHQLEKTWNTSAEIILEAIARSSDLTKRGIRGVIAEAAFKENVIQRLIQQGWIDKVTTGNVPYDFLLSAPSNIEVKVQVKLQRQKEHRPFLAKEAPMIKSFDEWFVVEVQKTRGGKKKQEENGTTIEIDTRPYHFGDFDILAVSLHSSSNDWADFRYTIGSWLIPDQKNTNIIYKYQPVSRNPNQYWTDNWKTCIGWFKQKIRKTISP